MVAKILFVVQGWFYEDYAPKCEVDKINRFHHAKWKIFQK